MQFIYPVAVWEVKGQGRTKGDVGHPNSMLTGEFGCNTILRLVDDARPESGSNCNQQHWWRNRIETTVLRPGFS